MGGPSRNQPTEKMLTFKGGGYILLLAALPVVVVLVWAIAGVVQRGGITATTLGNDVASYGFDLSTTLVPRDQIIPGAEARDFIEALVEPSMISADDVDRINAEDRGKYLVSGDRVIGIEIDGEARAYPLRMLDWHEAVNDVVGPNRMPVLITYNGLCESVVVFDRRIGQNGEAREFGVSGLLYNSNHLLYDRVGDAGETESLWLQLQARAIAGPAAEAGQTLDVLPCELATWADWRARHPDTLVLSPNPDPQRERYYKRRTYGHYHSSDQLRFPVDPLPNDGRALKTRIVAVLVGNDDAPHVFLLPDLIDNANANGVWTTSIEDDDGDDRATMLEFTINADAETAIVKVIDAAGSARTPPAIYAFWFAWYAMQGG